MMVSGKGVSEASGTQWCESRPPFPCLQCCHACAESWPPEESPVQGDKWKVSATSLKALGGPWAQDSVTVVFPGPGEGSSPL